MTRGASSCWGRAAQGWASPGPILAICCCPCPRHLTPGMPPAPFHMRVQTPQPPEHPLISSLMGGVGGVPAFPGTMSWFDMARLLTTLTTASRLTLAPLTWTWPCSIETLVEVGARAREEGSRGSLPYSPLFCPKPGAAAGAGSPRVAALLFLPLLQAPSSPRSQPPLCSHPQDSPSPSPPQATARPSSF